MDINLLELWAQMGLPVRGVVIVLTLQAVFSLSVIVDRVVALFRAERASRAFAKGAAPLMESAQHAELHTLARKGGGPLAELVDAGLTTYLRAEPKSGATHAAELARRALERKGASLSDDLNRGMNVLASTGSTAPFVGLLGTVLGIIHAFHQIASEGSGGIGTIGGSIGEALIVTGYGLVVAIPTVLVFNWLSSRVSRFELGLTNAATELLDRLESEGLAPAETTLHMDAEDEEPVEEPAAERPKAREMAIRAESLPS
jgi:biopolymer transport protein ExbB/TolQ